MNAQQQFQRADCEDDLICQECGNVFGREDQLREHLRDEHETELAEPTNHQPTCIEQQQQPQRHLAESAQNTTQQSQQSAFPQSNSSQGRVFNREAFCELCQVC